jgi:hypothetical protein
MRGAFVDISNHRIELEDYPDMWIEIPEELNIEEQLKLYKLSGKDVDWKDTAIDIFVLCVRAWNFKDDNGKDVPLSESAIKNLRPEVFSEFAREILAYTRKADQKKGPRNVKTKSA